MLETILVALIVCKIKGYKIKPLFKSWTVYPVIFMEIITIAMQVNLFMGNYTFIKYGEILKILYICSYLPMVFKYSQYISAIIGSVSVMIGGLLNDIAIKANGGMMPAFPNLSYITGYVKPDSFARVNDIHILGSADTNLKFLTDIFDLGYSILSIGDIFIRFYVFIIIFNVIKSINKSLVYKTSLEVTQ
ncbi:DUF5317 domain-containing protein [Clostridium sardiniense]|uniref:DUF5317 domain-containing protein n=1 Tax=Clostridium sardiniense TaxID=29369 RepID=A0ABS7KU18_CLOSR|nr:DUF5317 family protein [Clostridium sardiniense]MBY0754313.1 DUF5317 domain-containing protein [Clostridium sardiniense]MDQ0461045.1 hypothetical protein [Clostridium sardiniense]